MLASKLEKVTADTGLVTLVVAMNTKGLPASAEEVQFVPFDV